EASEQTAKKIWKWRKESGGGIIRTGAAILGTAGVVVGNVLASAELSKGHEMEADTRGVQIMAEAGYDPDAAVTNLDKLTAGRSGGSLLSTHPDRDSRLENLQQQVDKHKNKT